MQEEHEELADDLETEADDLERHGDEVSGRIEETKKEWEQNQQDSAVPGAEPPHEEDHEGYRGHSEAEAEPDSS